MKTVGKKGAQRLIGSTVDGWSRDAESQGVAMETGEGRSSRLGLEIDGQNCAFGAVLDG